MKKKQFLYTAAVNTVTVVTPVIHTFQISLWLIVTIILQISNPQPLMTILNLPYRETRMVTLLPIGMLKRMTGLFHRTELPGNTGISYRWIEPTHGILALFVLRNSILQTRMCRYPMGLDVWFLVGPFVHFLILCVRTAKALVRPRGSRLSLRWSPKR